MSNNGNPGVHRGQDAGGRSPTMPERRIRLFREGVPTVDGRTVTNVTWDDEPLPFMQRVRIDHELPRIDGGKIIGTVTDVQREDGGWVSGVVHTEDALSGYAIEVDMDNAVLSTDTPGLIRTARLRAVWLGTNPAWPGLWIGVDDA